MPSLNEIVDSRGKVNYKGLLSYLRNHSKDEFVKDTRNPLLVGKQLYDGELKQRAAMGGNETHTLIFNAAEFRNKTVQGGSPKEGHANKSISHAIYVLKKQPDSSERTPNIITVGRSRDNDVVIPDYVVSKHHAQIQIFYGKYFIVDNNSTNGTSVNQKSLKPGMKVQLPVNVEIAFGRLCFVFISPINLYNYLVS